MENRTAVVLGAEGRFPFREAARSAQQTEAGLSERAKVASLEQSEKNLQSRENPGRKWFHFRLPRSNEKRSMSIY